MEKNIIFVTMRATEQVVLGQLFANLNQSWTTINEHNFLYSGKEVLSIHALCYLG